ncbi:MAG: hypothetical protein KDC98_14375 [Planctomycetes bacterium]|nr:hypothetical protein [Planctomycetota bacterium]
MKRLLLASLLLGTVANAQTYNVTERGPTCGADMSARLVTTTRGPVLGLALASRLTNSFAVVAIGSAAPSPHQLPGGRCQLYVQPRATILGSTDANGHARFAFRVPPVLPIDILFQGVVLDVSPAGRHAVSSDVIQLRGR